MYKEKKLNSDLCSIPYKKNFLKKDYKGKIFGIVNYRG